LQIQYQNFNVKTILFLTCCNFTSFNPISNTAVTVRDAISTYCNFNLHSLPQSWNFSLHSLPQSWNFRKCASGL